MGFMILLLFCLFGSALWIIDQLIGDLALRRKDAPQANSGGALRDRALPPGR